MDNYIKFICRELKLLRGNKPKVLNTRVPLPRLIKNEKGEVETWHTKIGVQEYVNVEVIITNIYSRSVEITVKFLEYEVSKLFYINYSKSPNYLFDKYYSLLRNLVYKTLIDDGKEYYIIERYETLKTKTDKIISEIVGHSKDLKFQIF